MLAPELVHHPAQDNGMATDNDSFETAGQRLLKARAWDMLPKAAQHALALGWNRHHEARRDRKSVV